MSSRRDDDDLSAQRRFWRNAEVSHARFEQAMISAGYKAGVNKEPTTSTPHVTNPGVDGGPVSNANFVV